jgi:hypothetical protein
MSAKEGKQEERIAQRKNGDAANEWRPSKFKNRRLICYILWRIIGSCPGSVPLVTGERSSPSLRTTPASLSTLLL